MLDNAGHEMFPHYEEIYANVKAFFKASVAVSYIALINKVPADKYNIDNICHISLNRQDE